MSRTRHARIQEIFLAAVELPEAARIDFLESACGEDGELRRVVVELLAADDPPTESPLPTAVATDALEVVQGTGTYRVLGELGRGGMGVVYLAERSDGAFRRRVALKVLKHRAGDGGELVQRFRTERQILAALDHPNIARLLDGGTLLDGSPFLVMEHVEGERIDRFVDQRALPVEARLELFVAVCEAVQAAHQSLVVHRDLKPSNVLVTAEGVPKLLDFGIAKLLDPQAADWTVADTHTGNQPLTPRYASPEQLGVGPITAATDVYALGVLLYELLTGSSPYRPQSSAIQHWVMAVCEQEPRLPSAAVLDDGQAADTSRPSGDRRELRRRLAGDLDHIVLMALSKEPRRRYATAAEMAADLRRHLDGLPIRARRATLPYRAGKFVRRNRWGVAAALTLAVMAGSFTVGLERQLRRTEVERDKSRIVTDLLVQVFSAADPGSADEKEPTAREVLDRGLAMVREGLDDQPEVKAALVHAIGRVYNNLGRVDEAIEAHELALELRQTRREAAPLEYADSLDQLAIALVARSDLERAEAMYREALEVTTKEVGEEDPRTIARLDGLQQVLSKAGHHEEAEALARKVVEATLRRLGFSDAESVLASHDMKPELVPIATTLGSLAAEQRQLGHYAAAVKSLEQALALNRRLLGDRHYGVAFNLNNLANVYSNREQYEAAFTTRNEALAIAEAVFGTDHPSVGSMRLNQGFDLCKLDRCEEALGEIALAREVFIAVLGQDHPAVAMAISYSGLAKMGLGQLEEALALQREALELRQRVLGEDHPDLAQSMADLAEVLHASGQNAEAIEQYARAVATFERALGPEHPDTLGCRSRSAEPLLASGRHAAAREALEPAVAILEARNDLPRHLARAHFRLARALTPQSPPSAVARRLAEGALAALRDEGDNQTAAAVEAWLAADGSGV